MSCQTITVHGAHHCCALLLRPLRNEPNRCSQISSFSKPQLINPPISFRLTLFRTYVICLQTQHIESNAEILRYDAESDFELLNFQDQAITVDNLCEILKQSAFEGN